MTNRVVILTTREGGPTNGLTRVCGMPILERTLRAAQRGGFSEVIILGSQSRSLKEVFENGGRLGIRIRYVPEEMEHRPLSAQLLAVRTWVERTETVFLTDQHLLDVAAFQYLATLPLNRQEALEFNGSGVLLASSAIFTTLDALQTLRDGVILRDAFEDLIVQGRARKESSNEGVCLRIEDAAGLRRAERTLLTSRRSPTDAWVSRVINGPMSRVLARFLSRTRIHPDHVSFASTALAMISPLFMMKGGYWGFVAGTLSCQIAVILYRCQGELARLKFVEPRRGEWVDTVAHSIGHILFAIGLLMGLYHEARTPYVLGLGFLGLTGIVALLVVMFRYLKKVAHRGTLITFERDYTQGLEGERDWVTAVARSLKPLLRRANFTLLFLILALLNRPDLILFLISFGTNLALLLVYRTFRRRYQEPAVGRGV